MWPVHCVQNSSGAEFNDKCPVVEGEIIVDKGTLERVDSYSGFGTPPEKTELEGELRKRNVNKIYVCGLAYDYCVGSTCEDGAKLGFETYCIMDATRSVAKPSEEAMKKRLDAAGVKEILSTDI